MSDSKRPRDDDLVLDLEPPKLSRQFSGDVHGMLEPEEYDCNGISDEDHTFWGIHDDNYELYGLTEPEYELLMEEYRDTKLTNLGEGWELREDGWVVKIEDDEDIAEFEREDLTDDDDDDDFLAPQ